MQDSLFSPETDDPSRGHKDENSKAAHNRIRASKRTDRAALFVFIHESGNQGRTLQECGWKLGKPPSALSGRLTEMAALGMIRRKEAKGKTTSGCQCAIWVAK